MPALMSHQKDDIKWIDKVRRGLLGNEPGLGKSRSAIEATKGMDTLVVAPAMVIAGGVWEDQLQRWAEDPSRYTVASFTSLNARKSNATGPGSKVLGYPRAEYNRPWDAVIVDEAHYMKNRDASWTDIIMRLAKTSEIAVSMTGTPVPNWSYEIFTTLQLIYPGLAVRNKKYGSFWRWVEEWFDTSTNVHMRKHHGARAIGKLLKCTPACSMLPLNETCEHYTEFVADNFGEKYRRVLRHHVLDLPPMTEQTVKVPMHSSARRSYNQLKRMFATTHEGTEVLAWTQGKLNVMLDLCTVSPWFLAPEGEPKGGKLDQLRADLAQRSRATLVLAHYKTVVEACHQVARSVGLRSAYIHGGVGSQAAGQAMRDFKTGKLDVLVGSLETVAEGHTFTNADMAIFVEQSFKPYRNEQALYRVYRMGQEWPVTIRKYICPSSIDEAKQKVLTAKIQNQQRVMTAAEFLTML